MENPVKVTAQEKRKPRFTPVQVPTELKEILNRAQERTRPRGGNKTPFHVIIRGWYDAAQREEGRKRSQERRRPAPRQAQEKQS